MTAQDLIIAFALIAAALFLCYGFIVLVNRKAENAASDYDSATDWPYPPKECRRNGSRWSDMSPAERRDKFESECG